MNPTHPSAKVNPDRVSEANHIEQENHEGEPPPVLKSWKNIYIVVLGNLLFWIALFTFFTWTFE